MKLSFIGILNQSETCKFLQRNDESCAGRQNHADCRVRSDSTDQNTIDDFKFIENTINTLRTTLLKEVVFFCYVLLYKL